ncbi:hypothetical protein [Methylobacterium trifolii]|uniref:Lipoprotein n=1 Tax=Methylobacterium trifolii TaxID=1003092 RepID=A0ABQ4TUF0_9HYPH|nr:hypothetical protein [Methylobacterium trifolii]GJE58691.1 hypothetical protein MPOCJGCO_0773 [Methylobacterium trifolii]
MLVKTTIGLALLTALALGGCAQRVATLEGPPGRVPTNPFASNYPSAPPSPADAERRARGGGLLPPGRIPQ